MSSQSSVPESLTRFKNLLLTGLPGCGKTTVLERVAEHFGDLRLAGFLTLELREQGQRVGFEAVGLGGRRAILARFFESVNHHSPCPASHSKSGCITRSTAHFPSC